MMTAPRPPSFKQRLQSGTPQIGIRSQLCSTIVAEALGFSGCDYVYIDMEHSPNNLMLVLQQCQALAGTPAVPVIRLPSNDPVLIQQLLDVGIENIVVPMVETAEEARRAVAATRYPPRGIRSAARVHRGNRYGSESDYDKTVDQRVCLVVQVESQAAIARIADIAGVDGVDGVLFGPGDLAADFGHFGNDKHPDVIAAIERGVKGILAAGKFAGMSTGDPTVVPKWVGLGCRFISIAGDLTLMITAARRAVAAAGGPAR